MARWAVLTRSLLNQETEGMRRLAMLHFTWSYLVQESDQMGVALQGVFEAVFILRTDEVLEGKSQFAQLIEHIRDLADTDQLWRQLTKLFPQNPHYQAHYARWLALRQSKFESAKQMMESACRLAPVGMRIDRLSAYTTQKNYLLNHMRAVVMRQECYEALTGDLLKPAPLVKAIKAALAANEAFRPLTEEREDWESPTYAWGFNAYVLIFALF